MMERLTSNKPIPDMNMLELAYNSCYLDKERKARYRNYELDIDSRELAKDLVEDMCDEDLSDMSDEEFDEYMSEMRSVEMDSQIGLLALFYRNLWVMADLREKLKEYEDLEEQGRLLKLPCNRGDEVYFIKSAFSMAHFPIEAKITRICGVDCDNDVMYSSITEYNKIDRRFKSSDIGKTVFLTKSEAEAKLKELRGGEDE
jgi:chemotaxis methyl-accepting protein methylase